MKKMIVAVMAATSIAAALAMPTNTEQRDAQKIADELLQSERAALRDGKKSGSEVAVVAADYAAKAESEAVRYVLLCQAFSLYAQDKAFDKAADTVEKLRQTVPDIPSDTLSAMIDRALRNVPRSSAGRLFVIQQALRQEKEARAELAKVLASIRKYPKVPSFHAQAGELYAVMNDWPKALAEFSKTYGSAEANQVRAIALWERKPQEGKLNALSVADFWWSYPNRNPGDEITGFKRHAAEWYRKALEKGLVEGLKRDLVDKRLASVENAAGGTRSVASATPAPKAAPSAASASVAVSADGRPANRSFNLAKGVELEMVGCPAGSFNMGGSRFDNKYWKAGEQFRPHKVTFSKPFWIASTQLTCEQLSTFKKFGSPADAKKAATGVDIRLWDQFCANLTKKFQSSIPKGYVFRSPTEAEWEYAYNANSTDEEDPYAWSDAKCFDLSKQGDEKWRDVANKWGIREMNSGRLDLTADMVDVSGEKEPNWKLDNPENMTFKYGDDETDPVRRSKGKDVRFITRGRQGKFGSIKGTHKPSAPTSDKISLRLCLGVDLGKGK